MNPESSYIIGEPLRQAYKIDHLVNKEKISTTEASEASRKEIDAMIENIFNKDFTQNYFLPAMMRDKTMGQRAEDLLIALLNSCTRLHVNHGSEREDAKRKADMYLSVDDQGHEVPIQLATFTDQEKLQAKREKTPPDVLLVAVPMADIFLAVERNDKLRLERVLREFARQLFEGLSNLPQYLSYFDQLQEQLVPVTT